MRLQLCGSQTQRRTQRVEGCVVTQGNVMQWLVAAAQGPYALRVVCFRMILYVAGRWIGADPLGYLTQLRSWQSCEADGPHQRKEQHREFCPNRHHQCSTCAYLSSAGCVPPAGPASTVHALILPMSMLSCKPMLSANFGSFVCIAAGVVLLRRFLPHFVLCLVMRCKQCRGASVYCIISNAVANNTFCHCTCTVSCLHAVLKILRTV